MKNYPVILNSRQLSVILVSLSHVASTIENTNFAKECRLTHNELIDDAFGVDSKHERTISLKLK